MTPPPVITLELAGLVALACWFLGASAGALLACRERPSPQRLVLLPQEDDLGDVPPGWSWRRED